MGGITLYRLDQVRDQVGTALGRVIALAEAYPDLKANQNFAELQASLETMEGELQMS
ncbi:LemA family protein, partial [Rhizobium ruizarguesonis]